MKRIILILLILPVSFLSGAQSLTLSDNNGNVPNNGDIYITGGVDPLECYITVNNITSVNRSVECKKAVIQNVAGSTNYFCWGLCYPPNTNTGNSPIVIPANQSNTTNFSAHYDCQGNTGTAVIRYTFWVVGMPMDSVCFNVHYTGCTVGLPESAFVGLAEPYPNPATEVVCIPYSFSRDQLSDSYIEIGTLQGGVVQKVIIQENIGELRVAVAGMAKGLYYCSLYLKGSRQYTRKLLVQ